MIPAPAGRRATVTPLQKLHAKAKRTEAQDLLGFQLTAAKILHTPEYLWDAPRTKRRADFAVWNCEWVTRLLVEVDGGLYLQGDKQGGHTRGASRERDYERDADALMLGYLVLRCSPRQVKSGQALQWIQQLLA